MEYLRSELVIRVVDGDGVFALQLSKFLRFASLQTTRCSLSEGHNWIIIYTVKITKLKFDHYFKWRLIKFNHKFKAVI